ncbi:MAG: VOC family protein [Chloroflexi bacterium]|nr:VOC family protein [Chloroflexota bacterium]
MEARVSLVTLGTRDLQRSISFYRDGLGWPMAEFGAETGQVAFFRTGGTILTVYLRHLLAEEAGQSPEGSGFGGIVLSHNVRTRDEVDTAIAEVERAGGSVLRPARAMDWGGYCGHVADPDGHIWEIAWNPGFPILEDGTLQLP